MSLFFGLGVSKGSASTWSPPRLLPSLDYGALTDAGTGGESVFTDAQTGTTIDSGDSSSHWSITDAGILTHTQAGDDADLNGGPYVLVISWNGGSGSITINTSGNNANGFDLANAASFSTLAELLTALASADGKILMGRDGPYNTLYGTTYFQNRAYLSETIVTSHNDKNAIFSGVDIRNSDNITLDFITVDSTVAGNNIRIRDASADTTVQNCLITGPPFFPSDDFSSSIPTADGIHKDGTTAPSNTTIINNEIRYCAIGVNHGCTGTQRIEGNYIHECYEDCIKMGIGPTTVQIWNNTLEGVMANGSDFGSPHADYIQFAANGATVDYTGISINTNVFVDKYARSNPQTIFMDDMPTGLFYSGVEVAGNMLYNLKVAGIRITSAKDCFVIGNTVASDKDDGSGGPYIRMGETEDGGGNVEFGNIAHQVSTTNNIQIGTHANSYSDTFVGPVYDGLQTRDAVLAAYAMKANGPADADNSGGASDFDLGAVGSGYVTFPTTVPGNDGSLDTNYDPRVIAPVLSLPTDAVVGSTTGSGTVSTTQGHKTVYVVVTTSVTTPSVPQILAGDDHADVAATYSGNQAITASGVQNLSFTGLSAETEYFAHYAQTNIGGLDSAAVSADGFTTSAAPIAFPVVESTSTYVSNSASTASHVVTLPTGIVSGDFLVLFFNKTATSTVSITGWTQDGRIWTRTADGTEGSTVTVTTSVGSLAVCTVHRISGHLGPLEIAFASSNDPPSLSPTWGNLKTLWLSYYTQRRSDWSVTPPTNYGSQISVFNNSSSSTTRVGVSAAHRDLEASSEDPGVWTLTGTESSPTSYTVSIQSSG